MQYEVIAKIMVDNKINGYLLKDKSTGMYEYKTKIVAAQMATLGLINAKVFKGIYILRKDGKELRSMTYAELINRYKTIKKEEYKTKSKGTSKGNQTKWYNLNYWYKADDMGYEGLVEEIVSQFSLLVKNFANSNDIKVVQYTSGKYRRDEKLLKGCKSPNFIPKGKDTISFENILTNYNISISTKNGSSIIENMQKVIDVIKQEYNFDASRYFKLMFLLDAIVLNEDRHTNNIVFIIDSENNKIEKGVIFDNGLSLLSDTETYRMKMDYTICMREVKSRPFSTDFNKQLKAIHLICTEKFIISKKEYIKFLSEYKNEHYSAEEVRRALNVLKKRVNELEGGYIEWKD